jgi:predicted nicotinamide N-methyase
MVADEPADRIRRHTIVASVPLVPELRLHLVAEDCALWIATEADALAAGLPEPYWAFAWPWGQALARYLLDHPELVRGRTVLDFGCGGAIEALAALRAGARSVLAADLDPIACEAAGLNAALNGLEGLATTTGDLVGAAVEAEVVVAGDVFYDPALAARGLAWLERLAAEGRTVLVGDPRRGFLDVSRLEEVARHPATHDGELDPAKVREAAVFRVPARC